MTANVDSTTRRRLLLDSLKKLNSDDIIDDTKRLLRTPLPSGIVSDGDDANKLVSTNSSEGSTRITANGGTSQLMNVPSTSIYYDKAFKKKCLDRVIDEYSIFFRVSRNMEDTRSLYLLTMATMIDEANKLVADSDASNDAREEDEDDDVWDLDSLSRNDELFFSHSNWPSVEKNVSVYDQYDRMLDILDRPATIRD